MVICWPTDKPNVLSEPASTKHGAILAVTQTTQKKKTD